MDCILLKFPPSPLSPLGEGWLAGYGIGAAVYEVNVNWIAGLKDYPSGAHWVRYGELLTRDFHEYFHAMWRGPASGP